jgi:aspartate/methionine/tyrosine aminotransferase
MANTKYLNSIYVNENPLREIGKLADRVEQDTGISVVRCNMGDATGPTFLESNKFSADYLMLRGQRTGYADHAGEPSNLRVVANALTTINRLKAGELNARRAFCVDGGIGGLNVALAIFQEPAVLVTDPYYPPWGPIVRRNNGEIIPVPLRKEDGLLSKGSLRDALLKIPADRPAVALYHYPHNPTGKTLTEAEARGVATVLNELVADFPNLHILQEDLYLATTRSDRGIYTPLPYLSDEAKERTLWIHSPSKEGHAQDRGAIVATTCDTIARYLRGATAFAAAGMSTASLVGTALTLAELARGIEAREGSQQDENSSNHRYATADYYQERLRAVGRAFLDLEEEMHTTILDSGIPEGTYYLWPSLAFMKDRPIPERMRDLFDHDTVWSSEDIKMMLAHAYRIGLRPVTVAQGEIFTNPNHEWRIRIAAIDREPENLADASNTLKGLVGTVVGLDLNRLGVRIRSPETLQSECPVKESHTSFVSGKDLLRSAARLRRHLGDG